MQAQRPDGLAPRPLQPGPATPGPLREDRPRRIRLHDDGQAILEQDLKLRRLVLTGGGVKGAAYPGALKALQDTGQLAHIREVGGTSIGAVVAALVAAGMDAESCKTLLDQINLPLLFSRKEKPAAELKKPPHLGRLRSQLSIAANLASKAPNLKSLVDQATRQAALERIQAQGHSSNMEVERIGHKLTAGEALTFGDLHTLSGQVPGVKDMYCTSTAVYSGPGVQGQVRQLALFSSSDDACKHMELAEAVCASAALPVVFKARQHSLPHDLADSPTTRTRLTDGGVTLNTPIRELIDPDTPPVENLVLYFEKPLITQARLGTAGAKPPSLAQRAITSLPIGRHFISKRKFLAQELVHGPQAHQAVEAKLKGVAGHADYSGSKGRLAIWMTQAEKDQLQQHLHDGVIDHLKQRSGDQTFPSPYHLLLSLDDEALRPLRDQCINGEAPAIHAALLRVDGLRDSLGRFLDVMKGWSDTMPRDSMAGEIVQWMAATEATLGGDEHCQHAWAQALAGDPTPPVQRLFDLLRGGPAPACAQSLHAACLREEEARAAHRIAQRIRAEFIYPSIDKPLQVSRNAAALRRADAALSQARTRAEINSALRQLGSDYAVLGLKALRGLSPVVSKLKTYYLAEGAALR